jgi:hypothetical protein
MPVVIKKSDNGFVDATRKLICLPSHLGLVGAQRDALRRAAVTATAAAAAAAFSFTSLPAQGAVQTINNGGVTAQINTGTSTPPAEGLDSLIVGGVQQIGQQTVYFRDTSTTTGNTAPINTLGIIGGPTAINNTAPAPSTLDVTYGNTTLSIETVYGLSGTSNGASMTETITATNLTGSSLPLTLVEYSNFTLNNQPSNSTIQLSGTPTNTATQYDGQASSTATMENQPNTGGATNPSYYQADLDNSTILNEITGMSSTFTHLTDTAPSTTTEGNASYAFEWDATLAASGNTGSSLILSTNWTLSNVPEPMSATMIVGLAAMWSMRRPRRSAAVAS